MDDDDDVLFDTPFTVQELLLDCPEEFVFCGTAYTGEVQTAWHSDENVPISFDVHDADYDYSTGYDATEPKWVEVLWDLVEYYGDAITLDEPRRRLLLQAKWEWINRKRLTHLKQVEQCEKELSVVDAALAGLSPVDEHSTALLKVFGQVA